ncbi:MAG: TetR/AcrR family transcriptional regulator [Anaerolineae bacterium]|nr:TetR/AcrR family transcriptional regulator [Anaerolineae bacterium]
MGLQRGQRQTDRTKKALVEAFIQLIHEKNYTTIAIGDITKRANTGRSTFYRYFQTKADVLVSLHEDIFNEFSLGLETAADWLAEEPPSQLVAFLQQAQAADGGRMSLSYKLGKDVDYVVRRINEALARQFEAGLHHAFAERDSSIPFCVLAQSIAGIYSWLILSWFMERQPFTAQQLAGYIHRLTRATIREAFEKKGETGSQSRFTSDEYQ